MTEKIIEIRTLITDNVKYLDYSDYERRLQMIEMRGRLLELRYNHNHDEKGRFCSGGGGGRMSSSSDKRLYSNGGVNPNKAIDKSEKSDIMNETTNAIGAKIKIVERTELTGDPNSITQKISKKGGIERNYYDENGRQFKQIANNNHGNAKQHPYGKNGEHAHDYIYNESGKLIGRPARELTVSERKENSDIL